MAKDAAATVTFTLVWQTTTGAGVTGSDTIDAVTGDVLTLGILMSTDQTLRAHGVSLNFDVDLGNELNLFDPIGNHNWSVHNWSGTTYGSTSMTATYSQLAPVDTGGLGITESTGATAGRINTFNSGVQSGTLSLPTGTYTVGTARFIVNNAANDGADLFLGLFNEIYDSVFNNANELIPPSELVFGSASVNAIPEPGTAALVGLGLIGILIGARRSRRS